MEQTGAYFLIRLFLTRSIERSKMKYRCPGFRPRCRIHLDLQVSNTLLTLEVEIFKIKTIITIKIVVQKSFVDNSYNSDGHTYTCIYIYIHTYPHTHTHTLTHIKLWPQFSTVAIWWYLNITFLPTIFWHLIKL